MFNEHVRLCFTLLIPETGFHALFIGQKLNELQIITSLNERRVHESKNSNSDECYFAVTFRVFSTHGVVYMHV